MQIDRGDIEEPHFRQLQIGVMRILKTCQYGREQMKMDREKNMEMYLR